MVPSLLEEGLYYPDGQIYEEVYVYGSFVQSEVDPILRPPRLVF